MMDTTGAVTIVAAKNSGDFSTEAAQHKLTNTVVAASVSLSSVIRTMLDTAQTAVQIFVDTKNRVVAALFTDGDTSALQNLEGISNAKFAALRPVSGQTGRTLEFEYTETPTSGFPTDIKAVIDELIAPVAPTYSVEALTQQIAKKLPQGKDVVFAINQDDGTLLVAYVNNSDVSGNLNLAAEAGTDGVLVELSSTSAPGSAPKLVFE